MLLGFDGRPPLRELKGLRRGTLVLSIEKRRERSQSQRRKSDLVKLHEILLALIVSRRSERSKILDLS
jgi:hypothetical protein